MTGHRILIIMIASVAIMIGIVGVASTSSRTSSSQDVNEAAASAELGTTAAPERPSDAGEAPPETEQEPSAGGGPPLVDDAEPAEPVQDPGQPASRLGGRVEGFPEFIPIAPGSTIVSSAVTSDGGRVQATLEAVVGDSPEEVLALYRERFAALAFAPLDAPSVGGSTAITFTDGTDTVVVTVTDAAIGGSRYSIFGIFTTGRDD